MIGIWLPSIFMFYPVGGLQKRNLWKEIFVPLRGD